MKQKICIVQKTIKNIDIVHQNIKYLKQNVKHDCVKLNNSVLGKYAHGVKNIFWQFFQIKTKSKNKFIFMQKHKNYLIRTI